MKKPLAAPKHTKKEVVDMVLLLKKKKSLQHVPLICPLKKYPLKKYPLKNILIN
jgi:hypothetical protein